MFKRLLPLLSIALLPQVSALGQAPDLFASAVASVRTPAQLPDLSLGQVTPYIVASGNINASPYLDAWINNRGIGYDGVASLQLNRTDGTFICSGSLLAGGRYVLTAAHCVANASGTPVASSVDVNFFPGPSGNTTELTLHSTAYYVKSGYGATASAIDPNDFAIIELPSVAPTTIDRYSLFSGNPINSTTGGSPIFDVVGFGNRASGGAGTSSGASFTQRRHAYNVFDFDMSTFYGASYAGILIADFDNGTTTNDASCFWFGICQTGVSSEGNTAGGDSGGPAFITVGGQKYIAGVTSFGWRPSNPGAGYPGNPPDIDTTLDSSYGELSGWVSAENPWLNQFLTSNATSVYGATAVGITTTPEPASLMLLATGLGLVLGAPLRRRRGES